MIESSAMLGLIFVEIIFESVVEELEIVFVELLQGADQADW